MLAAPPVASNACRGTSPEWPFGYRTVTGRALGVLEGSTCMAVDALSEPCGRYAHMSFGLVDLLRIRSARRLMTSSACSSLAAGIFLGSLPLAVAAKGGGPVQVGLASAALMAWWIAAVPLSVVVDRLGVGRSLRSLAPLRIVALLVIGAHAFFSGSASVAVIIGGALLYGLIDVLADTATSSLPALVVDEEQYDRAFSMFYSITRISDLVIGSTVGAVIFSFYQALPFIVAAAALLAAYVSISPFFSDPRTAAVPSEDADERANWRTRVFAGLSHISRDGFLRPIAITMVGVVIAEELVAVVVTPYFRDHSGIHEWARTLGYLRGGAGVAAVISAVIAGDIASRFGRQRVLKAIAVFGSLSAGVLAISARWGVVLVALAVSGIAEAMWVPLVQAEVARRTPASIMGRTRAAMMFLTWGALPVTSVLGGSLASILGVRLVLAIGCGVALVSCLLGVARLSNNAQAGPRSDVIKES